MKNKIIPWFISLLFAPILTLNCQDIHIIPKPQDFSFGKGTIVIDENTLIINTAESSASAAIAQNFFKNNYDFILQSTEFQSLKKNAIHFKKDENIADEGYELSIADEGITICALDEKGFFYAVQSLIQYCASNAYFSKYEKTLKVKEVTIKDAPRFQWRAFMLDEARHFKGMEQVKMLLDEMALLKMNVFHWHLVDDQGWRIEIKKYPKLTQIGSKRKSTQIGPLEWESPIQSAEPHEGFYTQNQIKEIIKYAAERHITIVPEIEMPGHSSAAIAAYSWLGTSKEEIEVPIRFGVGKDVYDVSNPKVIQFLTDVLDEVMALFPSEVLHIGGDEVKYNHWKNSTVVNAYMAEKKLKTPADLQVYFTNNMSNYLKDKGKRMMGWNEIMGHNLHFYQDKKDTETTQKLAQETIVHFWKGDDTLLTTAASNGYEIVNSLHNYTYLDYTYKVLPLSKAYAFDPIPEKLDPKYHDKIIGLGAQMWGEWIPTNGEMHFKVFPRIAAYAEIGWTKKEHKNFAAFTAALKHLQKRWTAKGIYFASDEFVEKKN
ncbi:MAG: beta-N-acetylhexosaminidase [Polaribacter sp.]|nr:beta-N-acetylhexosaminidase [Polaribacter sp.]